MNYCIVGSHKMKGILSGLYISLMYELYTPLPFPIGNVGEKRPGW